MTAGTLARRLALLEGVPLNPGDLETLLAELEHYDRALAELNPFAEDTPWLATPAQSGSGDAVRAAAPGGSVEEGVGLRSAAGTAGERNGRQLWALGVNELSRLISAREVCCVELVGTVLDRLQALDPRLNAFISVLAERARAEAQQRDADVARGDVRGPLHGIPVTIKDMFATAGVRTTGASKILADWVPEYDAAVVERLNAAGAIIVGKTNQDEFGHGGTSTLSHFGPVHNPWDLERIAGGSSGGSAAAVAAGIAPLSYGTETGSSVRRPAAYCGIVGIKPTFGVISRYGSFRGAWSLDHVGTFGRSVVDALLGIDAVAGYDPRDPGSAIGEAGQCAARLQTDVRGIRVGVLRPFVHEGVDPAMRGAFEAALELFRDLGVSVRDLDVPELRYAAMTSMLTSAAESAANNARWLRERGADYVPQIRRRLAAGLGLTARDYLTAQRARQRIAAAVRDAFQQVDVIAVPTTDRPAPPIAAGAGGAGDRPYEVGHNQSSLLRLPSLLGLPGCSVPCGMADGLPLGLQLWGAWFTDQVVWNLAAAFEQGTEWSRRWPPIALTD
jgi:aspartyl-tRNA(Asn)/glutamyl-tRNA(Gln) amidotransferase subunit A